MPRPEIALYAALSLDGFLADEEGGVDWLNPFNSPDEDYGYAEFFRGIDATVMGSRTFEQALGFGPWGFAGTPSYVLSARELSSIPTDVTVTDASPEALVASMDSNMRVWLVGGAKLVASFREAHLIDTYILSVIPVLLGRGIPLFEPVSTAGPLKPGGSRSFANGVVQMEYRAPAP